MNAVPLQDASTILLLRDGQAGLEVLMVERSRAATFSAGAWVFPGGALEADDARVAECCQQQDWARCRRRFGVDDPAPYYIAAMRELFEEVGLWLLTDQRPADWRALQTGLNSGDIALSAWLSARDIRIDVTALHYFSFWTTPPGPKRRYRTRFFAAAAPADQTPLVDAAEVMAHCWTTPAAMLEKQRQGQATLIFPTICELEQLGRHGTVAEALQTLGNVEEVPETRTRHRIEDGRLVEILRPGEPGYEDLPEW